MTTTIHRAKPIACALVIALLAGLGAKLGLPLAKEVGQLHVYSQIHLSTATTGVAWSESGKTLAVYSGYGKEISVWDISGKKLNEMRRDVYGPWYESSIAFLGGDSFVLTPPASEHIPHYTLSVWDIQHGTVIRNVEGPGWAYQFTVSDDKGTAAISTDGGRTIAVYSTREWIESPRPSSKGFGSALTLALSSNGALLALGTTRGQVMLFETKTGNWLRTIYAYDQHLGMGVSVLAFSPDGTMIATGAGGSTSQSQDDTPVRIWAVTDGALVRSIHGKEVQPIRSITWRAQGDRIAFVGNNEVRVWNLADDTVVVRSLQPDVMAAAFSPNGNRLAVCGGNHVTIFEVGQSSH